MRKLRSIASALILTAGVSSSAIFGNVSASAAAKHASNTTLNIGLSADPPKLDPGLSSSLYDRQVMVNIYDTLFQVTGGNQIVPNLVQSYKISSNKMVYTLYLKKGIKFQDGTPFNAAAVKFNLQRDEQPISPRFSEVSEIAQIETPNDYTVILHLRFPFSPLLGILSDRAGMMASPTAVKKYGSDYVNHPVGTGPYEFVERVKGDHITLAKNPNYWQKGLPHFDKVVYKIFTDPNVELANLQSGAVQLVDTVPAQQLASLQSNLAYTVINKPSLGYGGFYINVKSTPFTNKYLREAVDRAIDRTTLVSVLFKGAASPAYSPFGPASPVYNKKEDAAPKPSASEIKSLLAKGGKSSGFEFTMQVSSDPVSVQMAQVIQGMLSQYGIKMNIQQLEFGTLLANANKGNYEANLLSWSGRYEPDQDIYQFNYTGGSQNDSLYSDPAVDKLLDTARKQTSLSDRAKTYAQVMDLIHADVPYVYLDHPNNVIAYSKQLTGFDYRPDGLIRVATLSQK